MSQENWKDVIGCDEVDGDFPEEITVDGIYLAIFNCDGRYFAASGFCSHEDAKLCDGYLEGGIIECPLHHSRFEVASGKVLSEPATEDLVTYPVEIREGRVFVLFPS